MSPDEQTLGQLVTYRLDRMEIEMQAGFAVVERRFREMQADIKDDIQAIKFVSLDQYISDQKRTDDRIDSLKTITWWVLTIVSAMFAVVLTVTLRSAT